MKSWIISRGASTRVVDILFALMHWQRMHSTLTQTFRERKFRKVS